MSWTKEREEMLKEFWANGLSASQIAAKLGNVSRNAVIGKVHRLQLAARSEKGRPRSSPTQPKSKNKKVTQVNNVVSLTTSKVSEPKKGGTRSRTHKPQGEIVVPISRNLNLSSLTADTCKWPQGDPLTENFAFCGCAAVANKPYCLYHTKIAYIPLRLRRVM